MAESANTLFHFTNEGALRGILLHGFHPRYSSENLSVATPTISKYKNAHVPMVCFCDLPLSRIRKHIEFYGEYGIGMRKEGWGIERGISPIIYLPETSNSSIQFQNIAVEIGKRLKSVRARTAIRKQLQNFYKYIKPYKGKTQHRQKQRLANVTYYHEREWRYVPEDFPVISNERATPELLRLANERMQDKKHRLGFEAHNVKYIIVKTEREISQFADFIHKDLREIFVKEADRNLLVSKLISAKQIKEDM